VKSGTLYHTFSETSVVTRATRRQISYYHLKKEAT
jgi:hypothetical protein